MFCIVQSVKLYCKLWETRQAQQANLFKHQTLTFHSSAYHPTSLNHLSVVRPLSEKGQKTTVTAHITAVVVETTGWPGRSLSTVLSYNKPVLLILKNIYHHILWCISVNSISNKYLCPQKQITEHCCLRDAFNCNATAFNINDVILIKLTTRTQN